MTVTSSKRILRNCLVTLAVVTMVSPRTAALERLCDPASENCRTSLLALIDAERVGIDVAFWFMEDARYSAALIRRFQAGVPIRVLFDSEAIGSSGVRRQILDDLVAAGIPLRNKTSGGILHWKLMLFAGQDTVQFSGANYTDFAFRPIEPYVNYIDEVVYFTDRSSLVDSFKTRFDDVWTTTSGYTNYANVQTPLTRTYPTFPIDSHLNFVPWQNFSTRSVARYNAETQAIDAIVYRITDRRHTDAVIAARGRGVPVRIITEQKQYRDPSRLWHAWNVDRLYTAGVQVRLRAHAGLTHEKLTLLASQGMVVFGSSNWTSPSASSQLEHNLFTTEATFYAWARDHFERKWNNLGPAPETQPFVPLPPDRPSLRRPANGAGEQATTGTLAWYAGPWAHKYDVYLGTTPSDLQKVLDDVELGPSQSPSDDVHFSFSGLASWTTYYWQVVSRTMADVSRSSAVWSFTTAGEPPEPLPASWVTADIGQVSAAGSASYTSGTYHVAGSGADIWSTADEFRFVYRSWSGDGEIVARVATVSNTDAWTKAGVMVRSSLSADSPHASMFVSAGKGLAFQRRTTAGGVSVHTSGGSGAAPMWVKLRRAGTSVSAFVSRDGEAWSNVGSDTISLGSTIYVGLALTSHRDGALASASFDDVSVSGEPIPPPLPADWDDADIGHVGAQGSALYEGGGYQVAASGADIWGTLDEFHFVFRSWSGDGAIVAHVAAVSNTDPWTKAGVMVRSDLSADSTHASMFVSPGKGLAFQRRQTAGGISIHTTGGPGTAPAWLKLQRAGTSITASVSSDGVSWSTVGTDAIDLGETIYVGLALTSHRDGALASASFDHVSLSGPE
jgi:phosphatidylserine/phosphatidylglycerophosphate/cardiolipin synthase-like enzyme/regulation of enolase protein 1 (concanavalin A-like superfamily)